MRYLFLDNGEYLEMAISLYLDEKYEICKDLMDILWDNYTITRERKSLFEFRRGATIIECNKCKERTLYVADTIKHKPGCTIAKLEEVIRRIYAL